MQNNDLKIIEILKKFPDKNPNPVIQISVGGILKYFNDSSKDIVDFYNLKLNKKVEGVIYKHLEKTILNLENDFEISIHNLSFYFNGFYTKEIELVNFYGANITARKVIDKFPDSNPNPVMRINSKGKLDYFNKSSLHIINNLDLSIKSNMPKEILDKMLAKQDEFEIEIAEKHFLFNSVKIEEFNFFLLYGTDVTDKKDKERILQKLSKYFSPQVYNSIFSGELDVTINTTRKELTVFFSDIKGFTTMAEKLEPEILTNLITDYLTKMTEIAIESGGTVDKYIGDAIMIFFGDPESRGIRDDALACVTMAFKMKKALNGLRKHWKKLGLAEPLDVRMGIHTDMCTVGNFGSVDRLDYTVLGNGVNLASRLESMADSNEILISENTFNLVKEHIDCNYFDEIIVKGKSHSIKTFQVAGIKSKQHSSKKIQASKDGFNLMIDKNKINDIDEIISLLEDGIEKLNDE